MARNMTMLAKTVATTFAYAVLGMTMASTAHAYEQIRKFDQPESRTEEHATTVIACTGRQENGGNSISTNTPTGSGVI